MSLQAPATLTPIPIGEDVDSLSAILLDEDYYGFIHSGVREFAGLPCVSANPLIPLKAHAWLDLTKRRNNGEKSTARKSQNI